MKQTIKIILAISISLIIVLLSNILIYFLLGFVNLDLNVYYNILFIDINGNAIFMRCILILANTIFFFRLLSSILDILNF